MIPILFILLLIVFIGCIKNKKLVEGIQSFNVSECSSKDQRDMIKKGTLRNYHSCTFSNPSKEDYNDKIKGLYINQIPKYSNNSEYTYNVQCPKQYTKNYKYLNKFKNKRQYAGYTKNKYLARTQYLVPDKPLPVNPDFFTKNGGTFA